MVDKINYLPGLGKSDHVVFDFNFNCFIEKTQQHKRSTALTRETTIHVQIS